jgi:pimeloyl-ACP methyl ester carboxylesterase
VKAPSQRGTEGSNLASSSGESRANLKTTSHIPVAAWLDPASIAILNHIADSRLVLLNNCGHWPPFEKPAEWTAQVLAFLKGY